MSGDISSAELRQSTSTSQTTPAEEKKIVSKSVELKAKDHSAQDGGTARRPGSTASADST